MAAKRQGLRVTVKFAFDQPTPSIGNYSVKNRVRVCSSSSHAIKDMHSPVTLLVTDIKN